MSLSAAAIRNDRRLMEPGIPEVYDGTVEIMSVSRKAGDRTKVAVRSPQS